MAYAVKQDIIDRYGDDFLKVVADLNDSGNIDSGDETTMITTALADAEAFIDSRILKRYVKPTATIPITLVKCTVDIGVYFITNTRGRLTDEIRLRYQDCIDWLTAVCEKKIIIPGLVEDGTAGGFEFDFPQKDWSRVKTEGLRRGGSRFNAFNRDVFRS